MSEDVKEKLDAYKQGYKDGYNDAVKFYILNPMKDMRPSHYGCPVCGRTGVSSVVCSVPYCPTNAYATGTIGAAGSSIQSTLPLGANGPSDSSIKPKEPLFNHQLDYSEYENNTYRRD